MTEPFSDQSVIAQRAAIGVYARLSASTAGLAAFSAVNVRIPRSRLAVDHDLTGHCYVIAAGGVDMDISVHDAWYDNG